MKYNCTACDYKATRTVSLKLHKQVKHERLRCPCGECDHQVTSKQFLKSHMAIKHGGEQFSCDECSYKGTRKQSLKSHMAFKHDGKQLQCEKCDYQSASKHSLKLHTHSLLLSPLYILIMASTEPQKLLFRGVPGVPRCASLVRVCNYYPI